MIKEIINFTKNLDEDFKNLGVKPREGLHIVLNMVSNEGHLSINANDYQFAIYTKKMDDDRHLRKNN